MLKSVVEHHRVGQPGFCDLFQTRQAVLAHKHGDAGKLTGNLKGFVAKFFGGAFAIDPEKARGCSSIPPLEHGPSSAFALVHQLLEQNLEVRRFARAADGDIAQNNGGQCARFGLEKAPVKCEMPELHANFEQGSHGGPPPTVLEDVARLRTFVEGS